MYSSRALFTNTEHVKLVSPQAAQLSILFQGKSVVQHLIEAPA